VIEHGNVLAIIPARGGSKGVPRKNVRLVAGEPLLAFIVRAALSSRFITRTIVSTDDEEIAAVAVKYGAEVVMRPAAISTDSALVELTFSHVLETLRMQENYEPDLIAYLQATSPLTLPEDIDGTIQALLDEEADSALAVMPFHYFLWARKNGDGVGINHVKNVRPMRQDREPQYLEAGAVVIMQTGGFLRANHRFFGKTALYEMPAERVLEIDEPHDLVLADWKLRERARESSGAELPTQIDALVLDFDGVLTDNMVLVHQDGTEAVRCSRADSWGIKRLQEAGIPVTVLSYEQNPVVQARCNKLQIECMQGHTEKATRLRQWLTERGYRAENIIYAGNDLNDIECMKLVGFPVAVGDAIPAVKAVARLVLNAPGGKGAVRELADVILAVTPS
jgi:N-acylneuraminate cytidylyltransferase